jgi:hypothetical protein
MNKIKPPTFDGENKKDEDAETWPLGMRKYFSIAKLFFTSRRNNFHLSTQRKSINVVGSICAGVAH